MELALAVLTGLAMSAACGFRVSVPPLVACLAALTGHLTLPAQFAWLGSWPALVALSVAAVALGGGLSLTALVLPVAAGIAVALKLHRRRVARTA